jgi:hypothetical protein
VGRIHLHMPSGSGLFGTPYRQDHNADVNRLDLDERVAEAKNPDCSKCPQFQVMVPLRLLMKLHQVKITRWRKTSAVVDEALTQNLADPAMPPSGSRPDPT